MKTPLFTASSIAAFGSATLILDSERRHIAKANGAPDAAFIVRACNSHAQLVAALERASMVAEYANRLSCCKTIKEATDAKLYSKLATALVEFREARAALQAAKE